MKSFISAIFISTNSASLEKICIGLIAVGESKVYFAKSDKKLSVASSLLKEKVLHSIKNSLNLIEKNVELYNTEVKGNKMFIQNFFTSEYFKYLNDYSQGTIRFFEPKPYSGIIHENDFNSLYETFVGENIQVKEEKTKTISIKHNFHQLLKKEAYKKVDIEYEIPANKLPSVYTAVKVDLICKNGSILTANALDFTASVDTIKSHIDEYTALIYGLEKLSTDKKLEATTNNLIAEAPLKNTEQAEIYNAIQKDKYAPFKLIKINQFNEVEKKIASNKYSKFSEYLASI